MFERGFRIIILTAINMLSRHQYAINISLSLRVLDQCPLRYQVLDKVMSDGTRDTCNTLACVALVSPSVGERCKRALEGRARMESQNINKLNRILIFVFLFVV